MKYKELIHTLAMSLLAVALCLLLTTSCTEDTLGDDTENTGQPGTDDEEDGPTAPDYYSDYTDADLSYDEANGIYTIYTERGLRVWARVYANLPNTSAVLANDIELGEDMPEWATESYNWEETDLVGITFDGSGHTVSGLRMEYDGLYQGFFRQVREGAEVVNLTVEGSMRYTDNTLETSDRLEMGGIAGRCEDGSIRNCTFRGTIDASSIENNDSQYHWSVFIGGIVGYACGNSPITGCTAAGVFTAPGDFGIAGGIVGEAYKYPSYIEQVEGCYTPADCYVSADRAGGIIGYANGCSVNDCSSEAEVAGQSYSGGIVGVLEGGSVTGCHTTEACRVSGYNAGGIAGVSMQMFGCYSQAEVTGLQTAEGQYGYAGGLAGLFSNDAIVGCYFAGTAKAPMYAGHVIGYMSMDSSHCIMGNYSTGEVTIENDGTQLATNIYYYSFGNSTSIPLTADNRLDWETTTAELNAAINAYNESTYGSLNGICEYHFEQLDDPLAPPTPVENEPGK